MRIRVKIGKPKTPSSTWIDYTESAVLEEEWTIDEKIGSAISVLELIIHDPNSNFRISRGWDVVVEDWNDENTRFFGGIIRDVRIESLGIERFITIVAQSYVMLLDRATIRHVYETVGQTDGDILRIAFELAELDEIILAYNNTIYRTGRDISAMNSAGSTLRSLSNQLSQISGHVWKVDHFKRYHYHPPLSRSLDFSFSDDPDGIESFPYYNSSVVHQLADWNSIELVGGNGLSDNRLNDAYSGDGVSKVYITGEQAGTEPIHYPLTNEDIILVSVNTGTSANPVWSNLVVNLEGESGSVLGAGTDVLWNPLHRRLEFDTAPPAFDNSFRVSGRYFVSTIVSIKDTSSIARYNREFKSSLIVPEALTVLQAEDLAIAYLKENSDKTLVKFVTNKEGLETGVNVNYTNTVEGINSQPLLIYALSYSLIGGELAEFHVEGEILFGS